MTVVGDSIEVIILRRTGAAERRPDVGRIAGMKIWPNGKVGSWHGDREFHFLEGSVEIRDGEQTWTLIARAILLMSKLADVGELATREMVENPEPASPVFDAAARDAARKAGLTEAEIDDLLGPVKP